MKKLLLAASLGLVLPALHAQDAVVAPETPATESATAPDDAQRDALAQDMQMDGSSPEAANAAVTGEIGSIDLPAPPEQVQAASPEGGDEGGQRIDEVIVTAQKTKQTLRKVPASVTALGGEFIQQTASADLADLTLFVPNARVDADDLGSPQIFIRGFGTNAFNPSFEGSVGFVQDELYFGRPGYFTEAMFDIDRVEVLRGPQGTLFGKNTIAGVFNVITKGPEDDFSAEGRYFYGEGNEQRIEAAVGGMFGDSAGARLAVLYRKQDGEMSNQFLGRDEESLEQKAARLKVKLFGSSFVQSELTAMISRTEAPFWPYQLMLLDADTRSYLQSFDPKIEDDPYDYNTSFDTAGFIEKGSDTISLKTDWNFGEVAGINEFTLTSVVGYSKFYIDQLNELDVSPADIARLDSHEDHKQTSIELRLTGNAESLFGMGTGVEFVGGAFVFDSDYTLLAQIMAGGDLGSFLLTDDFLQLLTERYPQGGLGLPGIPVLGAVTAPLVAGDLYRFDYDQGITSMALFGQFTWNLSERWAITPGLRFNKEEKRVVSRGHSHCRQKDLTGLPLPCVMEQLLKSNDYDRTALVRNEQDLSPKIALQYFTQGDTVIYSSYARGFKSGGFNAISLTGDNLEYDPEKAQTVELGFKGKYFDRTLGINATVYATKFQNLQVLAFNGVFFDVSNAATAVSHGVEADFLWLTPYSPLRLTGSFGLLKATYEEYLEAPAPIAQGIGALQDLSGKRIAFAPSGTATLTPMLTYQLGNVMTTFAGDVCYQGDQYTDTDLDPNTHVGGNTRFNVRVILANPEGKWNLSLGATNVGDKRTLNQVTDATFFPGSYFAQEASGRQLFATVSFKL